MAYLSRLSPGEFALVPILIMSEVLRKKLSSWCFRHSYVFLSYIKVKKGIKNNEIDD